MATASKQEKDLVKSWGKNPFKFFDEVLKFKERGIVLSTQQKNATLEVCKLVWAKFKQSEGGKLTDEEAEYARKRGISIMSGQGPGKDFWAACIILWFMCSFPMPLVPCTAPKKKQLRDILWGELSKVGRGNSGSSAEQIPICSKWLTWQSENIFMTGQDKALWGATAITANIKASADEQAGTLGGYHSDFMMLLIEEAAEVPDPVFEVFEGTMTGACNFGLIIFNPLYSRGYAWETHYGPYRDQWIHLRWNCEESENVSKSHIESFAQKYGKDSNAYRIRVLGLPPLADNDGLIPYDWILRARDREYFEVDECEPFIFGVDVGAGGNRSVIAPRQGYNVYPLEVNNSPDTTEVERWIARNFDEYDATIAAIDNIGIGLGVYCGLNDKGYNVIPVDVRNSSNKPEKFKSLRDELWWDLRTLFERNMIVIPDDQELIDELSIIGYQPGTGQTIKVDSKKDIKRNKNRPRAIDSPDKADALMMSFYPRSSMYKRQRESEIDAWKREEDESMRSRDRLRWLAA